ncbi:hypothetical protein JOD21_001358 [Jeotgalibacillus terrae]|nr:hypothetical protein [Jeotgalibacillus terrae]
MKFKIKSSEQNSHIKLHKKVLSQIKNDQRSSIKLRLKNNHSVLVKFNTIQSFENTDGIDQEFLEGLRDLFDRYDDTLKNLADR